MARRRNSSMKATPPAIGGRKSRVAWWSMARATITQPGSETSGTVGLAPGVVAGVRVGRPGTIGVLITDLAGVAALGKSLGRAATHPDPGGDPTGACTMMAVSRLGARVTRQIRRVTFMPGRVPAVALVCPSGIERTQRPITRAHTIHTPAPWPPANAQVCQTFT